MGVGQVFLQKLFAYVMLWPYTEFQCSTMPASGQKVCGGVVVVLVFSLAQAEQFLKLGCLNLEGI